jgi:hypothetical protein
MRIKVRIFHAWMSSRSPMTSPLARSHPPSLPPSLPPSPQGPHRAPETPDVDNGGRTPCLQRPQDPH